MGQQNHSISGAKNLLGTALSDWWLSANIKKAIATTVIVQSEILEHGMGQTSATCLSPKLVTRNHAWTLNEPHLPKGKPRCFATSSTSQDVFWSFVCHCQTSSVVFGWPYNGDCYLTITKCSQMAGHFSNKPQSHSLVCLIRFESYLSMQCFCTSKNIKVSRQVSCFIQW